MSDPTRLRHEGDPSERALLDTLGADAPSDEARAGMWKVIAAQGVIAGAATSASASILTKALVVKLAAVVVVGAAGVTYLQVHSEPARKKPATAAFRVAAPEADAATVDAGADTLPAVGPICAKTSYICGVSYETPAIPLLKPPKKRLAKAEVATRVAPPTVVPRPPIIPPLDPRLPTLLAESRLMMRARVQLRAHDLAGAEATLNQARDEFPQGALGQEREVMQIELLAALGDRDGADHRARRFLRKHPDSPHAKSVQRFLTAP